MHLKKVPGRKSDVSDAQSMVQVSQRGLLRGSFAPPRGIRELRNLIRQRTQLAGEHTRVAGRIHKVWEDAGHSIKALPPRLASAQKAVTNHRTPKAGQSVPFRLPPQ